MTISDHVTEVEATPVIETQIEQALATFDPVAAGLEELREKASGLQIESLDDTEGYALVRSTRLELKGVRVAVEKRRKELKEDSLRFGRAVDARAKEIIEPIRELEEPLHEQEKLIDEQRAERKAEEERAAKAVLDERVTALQEFGARVPVSTIADWDEITFQSMLSEYKERHRQEEAERSAREAQEAQERAEAEAKAETKRKAEEAERAAAEAKAKAEREAEAAKLAEERKALEAERAAAQAEREKIEAERRELAEAKRIEEAKARAIAEEKERAEQEKRAAELKAQREAELAAAHAKKKAETSKRLDHPYYKKARKLGEQIENLGPCPEGVGDEWTSSLRAACVAASRHLFALGQDVLEGKFDGDVV